MAIQLTSPGWRKRSATRGGPASDSALPGLPPEFLTDDAQVEEVILEPPAATRGRAVVAGPLDLTCDVEPGKVAILAVRLPSGALTFHLPTQSTSRGLQGPSQARFQVTVRQAPAATRGIVSQAVKAVVVKVAQLAGDKLVSLALAKLVEAFEKHSWKKRGLKEGWLRVTKETLAARALTAGTPVSPERSLLFIHGTFSNAASGYHSLASSDFFERVKDAYDDRLFAFDHFSLSRTPEENARMLLEGLPEQTTTFDVITHSRGGLVLRNLVERASQFGPLSRRFKLGRAVLVASPNEGTPLATPQRWDETIGFIANLLELFPDNPFTTGAEFVANGIVWLANHAAGDIPGLHAMDGHGDPITQLQRPPAPPADAYSALVANYNPTGDVLHRLLDVGLDQFFGSANDLVVPSEGGWQVDRSSGPFIPASRIGCFGPGGNLPNDSVTHVSFFRQAETADFLVNALEGRPQPLNGVDPRKRLPDHRLLRGEVPAGGARRAPTTPARGRVPARPAARGAVRPVEETLRVSVINGDLSFEPEALLLGHYTASILTGTEEVMNRLIGGTMEDALRVGLYPLSAGSHEIFINDRVDKERGTFIPRPAAVIVAGLGAEGKLKHADLVLTVRLAVIGWAKRLAEPSAKGARPRFFNLASTLIGSGGTGMSAGQAARLITQGVSEANDRLREEDQSKRRWPRCSHLRMVELYLDRATEAWHALRLWHAETPTTFEIDDFVQTREGALQRPSDSGYRGAGYDFITVEAKKESNGEPTIEYTLDTRRARSEVRGQRAQSRLLSRLVETASNDQNRDQRIGRTLASLLIPVELEADLAGAGEMQMALDPETAAIPWELLDVNRDRTSVEKPWAIRVKLLRRLRLDTFRDHVVDADADASVLIIGEPECPANYPRLFGARDEAIAVRACLGEAQVLDDTRIRLLVGPDPSKTGPTAEDVINALFETSWRIVHIAGHGSPGEGGKPGGVVLSNGTFLGPNEIRSMRVVPELVFVNCCYLARGNEKPLLDEHAARYDRARFASSVAGALIEIGVRCVVAAGWAVDDEAASTFASAFYASLLRGERFIGAVGAARDAAYEGSPGVNTWAAYQCYGDPDWRFQPKAPDANQAGWSGDAFSGVASAAALRLELDRLYVKAKVQGSDRAAQTGALQTLEKMFGERWGKDGATAELFGRAYFEAGAMEDAVRWYGRAADAPDGRASLKATEQLGNARSRLAWETVEKALRHRDEMARRRHELSQTKNRPATRSSEAVAARRAEQDAEKALRTAIAEAGRSTGMALTRLQQLAGFTPTMERENLVASAYKRQALVQRAAGRPDRVRRDVLQMKKTYLRALEIGKTEAGADLHYPASNILAADIVIDAGKRTRLLLDRAMVAIVEADIKAKSGANADFWSVAGEIELRQYQAIAARRLQGRLKGLEKSYRDLHERVTSVRMWGSVYDNAYLVLETYARTKAGPERAAADALLALLRRYAHPEDDQ